MAARRGVRSPGDSEHRLACGVKLPPSEGFSGYAASAAGARAAGVPRVRAGRRRPMSAPRTRRAVPLALAALLAVAPLSGCGKGEPTARCADGTLSYSRHAQGTCSWHGGVAQWINHP